MQLSPKFGHSIPMLISITPIFHLMYFFKLSICKNIHVFLENVIDILTCFIHTEKCEIIGM